MAASHFEICFYKLHRVGPKSLERKKKEVTFDLRVRSERLAAAAAIFRMSGLLLDFMMSMRQRKEHVSEPKHSTEKKKLKTKQTQTHHILPAPSPPAWAPPAPPVPAAADLWVGPRPGLLWPWRCSAPCRCPCTCLSHTSYPGEKNQGVVIVRLSRYRSLLTKELVQDQGFSSGVRF